MGLTARAGAMLAAAAASVAAAACGGELVRTDSTGGAGGSGAHPTGGAAGVAGDAASGGSAVGSEECPGLARPPIGPVELADFGELELVAQAVSFGGDTPESAVGFDLDCAAEELCSSGSNLGPRGIDNLIGMALPAAYGISAGTMARHVADGTWSVLVRLRSRPDGSVDVWLMNAERDPATAQGAQLPVWRPWPEQQGALGTAPSRATVRAGHVVSEPTGSLRLPLDVEILASRPLAIRVFADIAPQDERGVRRAVVAGRVTWAEVDRSLREESNCCHRFSCSATRIGDLRHADEPWQLCEDLSFGMELDLVPAVIGEPTSDRGGTPLCKD